MLKVQSCRWNIWTKKKKLADSEKSWKDLTICNWRFWRISENIQRERQNKYFQIRVCCSGTWRHVLTWTLLVRQVLSVPPQSQLDSALTGSRKQLTCVSVCPVESLLLLQLWTIWKFKLSCLFLLCDFGEHVHFLFQNKLWRQIYMIIRLLINWNQSTWWSAVFFVFFTNKHV